MYEKLKPLYTRYREYILYVVFGAVTTGVNMLAYWLLYSVWGVCNDISVVIAWIVAVIVAFLTNKPFVFESHDWSPAVMLPELSEFFLFRLGTGVLEWILMHILVTTMGLPGLLMKLLVNIIVIILNYIASKLVIFRKNKS